MDLKGNKQDAVVDKKTPSTTKGRTSCLLTASLDICHYNNIFGHFSFVSSSNTTKGKAN